MGKKQEKCLQITFPLNAQIEPILYIICTATCPTTTTTNTKPMHLQEVVVRDYQMEEFRTLLCMKWSEMFEIFM